MNPSRLASCLLLLSLLTPAACDTAGSESIDDGSTRFSAAPWLIERTRSLDGLTDEQTRSSFAYDELGRLTERTDWIFVHYDLEPPIDTPPEWIPTQRTSWSYTNFGQVASQLRELYEDDAWHADDRFDFVYTPDGARIVRATLYTYQSQNVPPTWQEGPTFEYEYTAGGTILRGIDLERGEAAMFAYDTQWRLATLNGTTTFAYDEASRLITRETPQQRDQFAYDDDARIRSATSFRRSAEDWIEATRTTNFYEYEMVPTRRVHLDRVNGQWQEGGAEQYTWNRERSKADYWDWLSVALPSELADLVRYQDGVAAPR